jgi:predicted nucleic acid-binding protein
LKLLLDTTYFLPAIGVGVRTVPRTIVKDLHGRGHNISICTITIFELAAKGAKFVRDRELSEAQVREGIQAILNDETTNRVHFQDPGILARAIDIRRQVKDFIDCLILAAAATTADALVSEDEELRKIILQANIKAKLNPTNPDFNIYPSRRVP